MIKINRLANSEYSIMTNGKKNILNGKPIHRKQRIILQTQVKWTITTNNPHYS